MPGGGVALVKAAEKLRSKEVVAPLKNFEAEYKVGWEIVMKAVEAPLRQIAINAGKDGSVIVEKVRTSKGNGGYDAKADEMVADMLLVGIIDPVKVTRSGLQNAASAAAILLTTEVAITEEPKEEKQMGGGMPGMDY